MAKSHKLDGTGLGLDTALSVDDLRSICLAVAPQATGSLWQGVHKIRFARESAGLLVFEMPALIKVIKQMIFSIRITDIGERRQLLTTINDYMTTQQMLLSFIPIGPRQMVGHHVYVEYLQLVAKTVREADPTAAVRLELGPNQRASVPRTAPRAHTATPSPPAVEDSPAPLPSNTDRDAAATPVTSVDVPIAQPSIQDPAVEEAAQPEGDVDRTIAVQRRPRRTEWQIVDDEGATVSVDQRTVLGRAPRALGVDDTVAVVGAEDSSVSNSHATVEVRGGQLFVTDLGSTNGTTVLDVDGHEKHCTPGEAIAVADGAAIELGGYTLVARSHVRRIR